MGLNAKIFLHMAFASLAVNALKIVINFVRKYVELVRTYVIVNWLIL